MTFSARQLNKLDGWQALAGVTGRSCRSMLGLQAAYGTSGCVSGYGKHCNLLVRMISARTLPRYQAANPPCCDQNMLHSSGGGATLSVNALHIRFATSAFAAQI